MALVISSVACQKIAHPDTAHQTSDFIPPLYNEFMFYKVFGIGFASKSEKYSLKADLYGMRKMF